MKMILLLSFLIALVGCKNPVTGNDISNPLSKEELFANSLDRQDGFYDVEVMKTFVGEDGQTYVALKWKETDDGAEEVEVEAGVFNLSLYNPLRSWETYVKTVWDADPFDNRYDEIDYDLDDYQDMDDTEVTLFEEIQWNPVTDKYRVEIKGTEYVFSEQSNFSKDLEAMGALIEKRSSESLGNLLVSNYGFSEERGQKIAKTFSTFKRVQKSRNLTEKDMNAFSEMILGSGYKSAKEAFTSLAEGDFESFDNLIEKAATHNNVSPEGMKAVVNNMIFNN